MEVPLVQNQMVGGVENLSGEELLNGTGFLLQVTQHPKPNTLNP
jgi:hypothetical protein